MTRTSRIVGLVLEWLNEKYMAHLERTYYHESSPWGIS